MTFYSQGPSEKKQGKKGRPLQRDFGREGNDRIYTGREGGSLWNPMAWPTQHLLLPPWVFQAAALRLSKSKGLRSIARPWNTQS